NQGRGTRPPSVRVEWRGIDPDREGEGVSGPPRLYKFKLVSQAEIQQAEGIGGSQPSQTNIQHFFTVNGDPTHGFANWDSVSAQTTFKQYEGVTPGQDSSVAVVSSDIAGAYEPRFNLNGNVLRFKPSTELQAPSITAFNSFFVRSQGSRGSFDLSESRVVHLEVPELQPIPMNWIVPPPSPPEDPNGGLSPGTPLAGYRCGLRPLAGAIFNEPPRADRRPTHPS